MPKEYQYKRYQLNLDLEDAKHIQIINYLERYKAGKNRNEALIKVILAGLGEKIELDLPLNNPSHIKTEQRLKKIDVKLDKILWSLINQYGLKEQEYHDDTDEQLKESISYQEPQEIKKVEEENVDDKQQYEELNEEISYSDESMHEYNDVENDVQVMIPEGIMDFLNGL